MTPMNPPGLELHPQTVAEARAARRWYVRRNVAAADRFMAELDRAMARIVTAPQQCPPYLHGTRFQRLRRFPYLVVFRETDAAIQVVAVAHGKRKPGYWKRRLS